MYRHLLAEAQGEAMDSDTGLRHAAHAAWNALARLDLMLRDGATGVETKNCRKCGGLMQRSTAMQSTLTGVPDFPSDREAITLSPGGPGKVVPCMKCNRCGWSVSA